MRNDNSLILRILYDLKILYNTLNSCVRLYSCLSNFPSELSYIAQRFVEAIQIMFSLTNFEWVNTISISNFFWVCFCALTLALYSHCFSCFLWGMESSCSMMLASFVSLFQIGIKRRSPFVSLFHAPWCWLPWHFRQTQRAYHALFCRRSGLNYLYLAAVRHTFWSIPEVLSTPHRSVRVNATSMFFLHRSYSRSEILHFCPALSSSALLGVGMQAGFSSFYFTEMTVTVCICP